MKSFIALTVIAAVTACSPVKIVSIDKADDFSLASYKTFDFVDVDVSGADSPSFSDRVEWIKDEISRQLSQKGLTQTSTSPELLLNIGVVVEEKEQTRETTLMDAPRYMGQRNYHWESQDVVVNHYKQGTVTVDFVDSKTNSRVCEAVASAVVVKNDATAKKNIARGVEQVLEKISGV
ncbi:MAG TPA: DUF4136 domain-containing protein [Cyclobacteriaceae bacterium]|nr:DUF4136 domain-containing protein [Cyclobacteriaceae bacterium]